MIIITDSFCRAAERSSWQVATGRRDPRPGSPGIFGTGPRAASDDKSALGSVGSTPALGRGRRAVWC